MKHSRFLFLLLFGATLFIVSACNDGGNKDEASADTTAKATTEPTAPAVVNTIVTTPQSMMVVMHKVANFQKWWASYDEHDSMRLANGVHNYVIGRGLWDSNMVLVTVKVDDLEKAKAFGKDASLKKAMQKSGVMGAPTTAFYTMTWQDTARSNAPFRSRTNFEVKDWDAWQKSFLEGKQERLDNGIIDRAFGHDAADNKKVVLVTAIQDSAKAFAYYKSDALKKRREAGGVTGEPKRFIYRVIKRY